MQGYCTAPRVLLHIRLGNGEATLTGRTVYSTKTASGFEVGIPLLFGDEAE